MNRDVGNVWPMLLTVHSGASLVKASLVMASTRALACSWCWNLPGSGIFLLGLPPGAWLRLCEKDGVFTHKHSMQTIVSVDTDTQAASVKPPHFTSLR